MKAAPTHSTSAQRARRTWNIDQWGSGYFDVDDRGQALVRPLGEGRGEGCGVRGAFGSGAVMREREEKIEGDERRCEGKTEGDCHRESCRQLAMEAGRKNGRRGEAERQRLQR